MVENSNTYQNNNNMCSCENCAGNMACMEYKRYGVAYETNCWENTKLDNDDNKRTIN